MRALSGLASLLGGLLGIAIFAVSIWGMLILIHQGHAWVMVLWLFMLIPGLVLPFFTQLWALALILWVAFFLVVSLGSWADEA